MWGTSRLRSWSSNWRRKTKLRETPIVTWKIEKPTEPEPNLDCFSSLETLALRPVANVVVFTCTQGELETLPTDPWTA